MPGIVTFDEQAGLLRVWGDEDRTTSGRRRQAMSCALSCGSDVVADLTGLRFADASLMVDLAVLGGRLRASGRALRLRGPQPHIQRLIELIGLHRQPAVQLDAL